MPTSMVLLLRHLLLSVKLLSKDNSTKFFLSLSQDQEQPEVFQALQLIVLQKNQFS